MTASSKMPDHKSNQNRRKDNEMCDTTVQWPANVRVLREALTELNEEHEKMNLGDPPDIPIAEINALSPEIILNDAKRSGLKIVPSEVEWASVGLQKY
ncbi:hypothetical protein BPAE_0138g00110 [Botrytis paeoniae]|uniref:Uncharacterized protein n=1 Tax=Botrytis paeoniae TaxID=278948 RepID=A0A4Z1FIW1_9HELO|nr:hypothetical protein BPAE_0138g00110 [Botrytis paeoniae]